MISKACCRCTNGSLTRRLYSVPLLSTSLACLAPRNPEPQLLKPHIYLHVPLTFPILLSLLLPLILFLVSEKRHVQRFLIRVCVIEPVPLGIPLSKFLIGFPGVHFQLPRTTVTLQCFLTLVCLQKLRSCFRNDSLGPKITDSHHAEANITYHLFPMPSSVHCPHIHSFSLESDFPASVPQQPHIPDVNWAKTRIPLILHPLSIAYNSQIFTQKLNIIVHREYQQSFFCLSLYIFLILVS